MKCKRILALLGIVLLVGIYLISLVCALIDHPMKESMMQASLYATVVIPVLIYAFLMVARLLHKEDDDTAQS